MSQNLFHRKGYRKLMVSNQNTKLRSAMSSAEIERLEDEQADNADQILIQQWLAKKENKVEVCDYNTRTDEEDIVYHWKKKKGDEK
jgi:hypothetical protein